jgi:hypothetical protein
VASVGLFCIGGGTRLGWHGPIFLTQLTLQSHTKSSPSRTIHLLDQLFVPWYSFGFLFSVLGSVVGKTVSDCPCAGSAHEAIQRRRLVEEG